MMAHKNQHLYLKVEQTREVNEKIKKTGKGKGCM